MEESAEEAEEVADALLAEAADDLAIALCFEVRRKSDEKWPIPGLSLAERCRDRCTGQEPRSS